VIAAKRHLDDSVLIRRYLADRGLAALGASDEGPLRHLAHCPPCESRYEAMRSLFDETRDAAIEDAEAASSASRLELQRERIFRRIDALHAGPRVLPFPAAGQNTHHAPQPRVFRRWVAAAAVAGLLVGLGAGRLMFNGGSRAAMVARQQIAPATAPASDRSAPTMRALHLEPAASDDQFLSEIEMATAAPRTRELRAIYAITLEEPRDIPRAVKKD
jgi:hypothetical protein